MSPLRNAHLAAARPAAGAAAVGRSPITLSTASVKGSGVMRFSGMEHRTTKDRQASWARNGARYGHSRRRSHSAERFWSCVIGCSDMDAMYRRMTRA